MNFQEKKQAIEILLATKLKNLQEAENSRNTISAEVLELQGQIKLLDEMLKEENGNPQPKPQS